MGLCSTFSAGQIISSFSVEIIDDNILENPPVNSMADLLPLTWYWILK